MSEDISECRICFEIETYDDPFISPCRCKGTSLYVHKSCLNTWRHFNRNSEGWKRCMECGEKYSFYNKYPLEKKNIFTTMKNPTKIYFIQYVTALSFGSLIWMIDWSNDYLAIKMLNFNIKLKEPSLLTYIKEDELSPQVFYFSYSMFIQSLIFYIYYCYKIWYNIKRKSLYSTKILSTFCTCFLFSMQFIIWYYICVFNSHPIAFLNIASAITMLEPFMYYILIKKHDKTIEYMNEVENEQEILSYVHNPIMDYEHILNNQIELQNIIIE